MFFHISHNDLDGYSCQLVSMRYFPDGKYFNCNYGVEVKQAINEVLQEIENTDVTEEEILFIISDLNPTFAECKELDNRVFKLKNQGHKLRLQLLDHHITGQKSAETFEWYFLDVQRCAAKIVYDYFKENFGITKDDVWLEPLINAVNSVDIWNEMSEDFEFGKVLMRMVSSANEINATLFSDHNREYRLKLLEMGSVYLDHRHSYIELDDNIHFMKKSLLKLDEKNETIDNLAAKKLVSMLKSHQENLTVFYKEFKGIMTYTLGNISIPANTFLKENPDFSFFIDVSKKGNVSFRAAGVVDVSLMATKIANGGGHKNASGGKFDDFVENMNYQELRAYVQNKLNTKG